MLQMYCMREVRAHDRARSLFDDREKSSAAWRLDRGARAKINQLLQRPDDKLMGRKTRRTLNVSITSLMF